MAVGIYDNNALGKIVKTDIPASLLIDATDILVYVIFIVGDHQRQQVQSITCIMCTSRSLNLCHVHVLQSRHNVELSERSAAMAFMPLLILAVKMWQF